MLKTIGLFDGLLKAFAEQDQKDTRDDHRPRGFAPRGRPTGFGAGGSKKPCNCSGKRRK